MVMISMMISTSMTSINGVVFISIIGSASSALVLVVCIDMADSPSLVRVYRRPTL